MASPILKNSTGAAGRRALTITATCSFAIGSPLTAWRVVKVNCYGSGGAYCSGSLWRMGHSYCFDFCGSRQPWWKKDDYSMQVSLRPESDNYYSWGSSRVSRYR